MRRLALWIVLLVPLAAAAQTYTYLDQSLKNGNPVHTAPPPACSTRGSSRPRRATRSSTHSSS
ncbi:MAG TPA: hypothetical protein VKA16_06710, partial [Burkholderiales bacterium]|nr:hypothetical protein [Burkholderiales bacterium]